MYDLLPVLKEFDLDKCLDELESAGMVELKGEKPVKKLENVEIIDKNGPDKVEDWISDWIELWPTGIKSGGYYIKGDKAGSLKKMKAFIKQYPQATKEQIFDATKAYIDRFKTKGYEGIKLSHFFINKDNVSVLASELENLKEKPSSKEFGLDYV